ncbi:MAG: DegT/DnrJ/EryC1/StrS family aminotransferase [Thermoplasmata archaeon]|nr:MAG: DegT/DnrJ/EryC1/StrS family aminotransferase [Thermoplasmata archaeon]
MIPIAEPKLNGNELKYVTDCVSSGWISSIGKYIKKFEEEFSKFTETKYGIATSSGTTALHLALATFGIGKDDEVIIPTLSFIATANCVAYTGAKPVFVDSEPRTWNMDPEKVKEKITEKTKAIVPVHLYGHPVDMDPIMDLAEDHSLVVIEDAAEAHGAEYRKRKVGGIGHVGCFSFYGNKIITCGEGGMITTNDEEIMNKAMMLRDHAMSKEKRYWHPYMGYNYRMTNMQAAVGLAQVEKIEEYIQIKRENAKKYNEKLEGISNITLPPEMDWAKNVYWLYSILVDNIQRDDFTFRLREKEIDTRPFFYPMHTQPPYIDYSDEKLEVAEDIAKRGVSLPSATSLKDHEIDYICQIIAETLS